jgi:hypothetical protein
MRFARFLVSQLQIKIITMCVRVQQQPMLAVAALIISVLSQALKIIQQHAKRELRLNSSALK